MNSASCAEFRAAGPRARTGRGTPLSGNRLGNTFFYLLYLSRNSPEERPTLGRFSDHEEENIHLHRVFRSSAELSKAKSKRKKWRNDWIAREK